MASAYWDFSPHFPNPSFSVYFSRPPLHSSYASIFISFVISTPFPPSYLHISIYPPFDNSSDLLCCVHNWRKVRDYLCGYFKAIRIAQQTHNIRDMMHGNTAANHAKTQHTDDFDLPSISFPLAALDGESECEGEGGQAWEGGLKKEREREQERDGQRERGGRERGRERARGEGGEDKGRKEITRPEEGERQKKKAERKGKLP